MSSNHDRPTPPKSPKAELLGELESIKGLLEDENELDIDIPILSDIVTTEGSEQHLCDLLDLKSIFEDDDDDEPSPLAAELTASSTLASPPLSPAAPSFDLSAELPTEVTTPSITPSIASSIAPAIELTDEPYAAASSQADTEQQPAAIDASFEGLEDYSLDDLSLDALSLKDIDLENLDLENLDLENLDLENLNLENLDTSIKIPSFKLSTALGNQLLAEQAKTDATEAQTNTEVENHPVTEASASAEEQEDMFFDLGATAPATQISETTRALDMDLLIQEIVDEFIPTIEDALRQKLSQCSTEVIKQLAEKHLQR